MKRMALWLGKAFCQKNDPLKKFNPEIKPFCPEISPVRIRKH